LAAQLCYRQVHRYIDGARDVVLIAGYFAGSSEEFQQEDIDAIGNAGDVVTMMTRSGLDEPPNDEMWL
jgi:hypothetical protein